MNRTVHKFCACSGALRLVTMAIGFVLIAGIVPTRADVDRLGAGAAR